MPLEVSGKRSADTLDSELHVIKGGPHGCNVSHADEFNATLIEFLGR